MRIPKVFFRAGPFFARKSAMVLGCLCIVVCLASLASLGADANSSKAQVVIHEWGTFTSLQNDKGEAIGGINSDDEPVPRFVHRLANLFLLGSEVPPSICQGAPHCHPDVTMRLETPVVYFHPVKGTPMPQSIDVSATFKGGWLSEYYPDADTDKKQNVFGPLKSSTVSTLAWKRLELGGDWPGPVTSDHVWTAPRAAKAANVRSAAGEAEQFLFYRGVAHLDAPLAISRGPNKQEIQLRSHLPKELAAESRMKVKSLWLVHIRNDGQVAFREIPSIELNRAEQPLVTVSTKFASGDYSAANGEALKSSLKSALVYEGLFLDEAMALINTWELSYFKSPGWRVFFLVPRAWTDFYLPLQVSVPAKITRVMVGRIELVSEEQKEALKELASFSEERIKDEALELRNAMYSPKALGSPDNHSVFEGRKTLIALGVPITKSYALYLGLGRFRNALLLDEAKLHPSKSLDHFIQAHGLEGHDPARSRLFSATTP